MCPAAPPASASFGGQGPPETWVVYVLMCQDDDLYTGCTGDLVERLGRHERG
ncbi:MAG: GIY-YIG nuclease family protein [Flavobacteriales bacterium]|nr:GIY-YIG nuclease family protein [Flavobacteriales bacterium]